MIGGFVYGIGTSHPAGLGKGVSLGGSARPRLPLLPAQFPGKSRAERRLERHYRHVEQVLRRWLEEYHARCCVLAEEALAASKPLPAHAVRIGYEVAFQNERYLSILWQVRALGKCRQFPELWDIQTGVPLSCRSLLPRKAKHTLHGRACLLTEAGVEALGESGRELIWAGTPEG